MSQRASAADGCPHCAIATHGLAAVRALAQAWRSWWHLWLAKLWWPPGPHCVPSTHTMSRASQRDDGLSLWNTWTSSRFPPTSFNVFKWGFFMKYDHLHYYMAGTLSSYTGRSYCVPIFLLAPLACCWESPVWTCCHSGNIFIPEHWGDLINWAKLPCTTAGRFTVLLAMSIWACLALWCPLTAALLPGDSCRPAVGLGLFVREVLHQIRNKNIKDYSHTSPFRFQNQSFLNTTLHTQFLVPVSTHLEAAAANFAFLMQHPVNSSFLLSLLTIFIISTVVIQSDP